MKNITLIAAIGKNNELGKNNHLIWHIPEDLKFFRSQTENKLIVMGLNTLNSLPKLLQNRTHLVLTHQNLPQTEQVMVFHKKEDLLNFISIANQEVMVIGGASIYRQFLDYADKMVLTRIDKSAPADCYFPKFSLNDWDETILSSYEYNNIKYKHLVYTRKTNF